MRPSTLATTVTGDSMRRPSALFPISLALGAMMLAPGAGAREPTKIKACQTIDRPGSYELANNLSAATGDCLVITADFVTIDLAGFSISSRALFNGTAILATSSQGIAVRNGSISGFEVGVDLRTAAGSIVEGLRVSCCGPDFNGIGIFAHGVVTGNTVSSGFGGIAATGTVTGNYATGRKVGISVGKGSTVIGNTVTDSIRFGLMVECPSDVINNRSTGNAFNLLLNGKGCNNTNNVAP